MYIIHIYVHIDMDRLMWVFLYGYSNMGICRLICVFEDSHGYILDLAHIYYMYETIEETK